MAGKRSIREARLMAEREGFCVLNAQMSAGSHIELHVQRNGRTHRVICPFSPGDVRGKLNHRAFLRRLARQMDQPSQSTQLRNPR